MEGGKYLVYSYETKITKNNRIAYIISSKHNNIDVEFWADLTLSNYIKICKPTEEFEIIVNRQEVKEGLNIPYPNSVTIPGYTGKIILKPKYTKT